MLKNRTSDDSIHKLVYTNPVTLIDVKWRNMPMTPIYQKSLAALVIDEDTM